MKLIIDTQKTLDISHLQASFGIFIGDGDHYDYCDNYIVLNNSYSICNGSVAVTWLLSNRRMW